MWWSSTCSHSDFLNGVPSGFQCTLDEPRKCYVNLFSSPELALPNSNLFLFMFLPTQTKVPGCITATSF